MVPGYHGSGPVLKGIWASGKSALAFVNMGGVRGGIYDHTKRRLLRCSGRV
jgi:hypothetical protein